MKKKVFLAFATIFLFVGGLCADSGYIHCPDGNTYLASWDNIDTYAEVRDVLCSGGLQN